MDNIAGVIRDELFISMKIAAFLLNTGRVLKAIMLCKECLILLSNKALDKKQELVNLSYTGLYAIMVKGYRHIFDYTSAIECCRNLLVILRRRGERTKEGIITLQMAKLYQSQSKYQQAKELCEKALSIMVETDNRHEEGNCYAFLGNVFLDLDEYAKAKEYYQKALDISKEIADRKGEASCYVKLGTVFLCFSEYDKAEEHLQKALAITNEIGDRGVAASCYGILGCVFHSLGKFFQAKEYLQEAIIISREVGDRKGEASFCSSLGSVFQYLGEYGKAEETLHKALAIAKEIGDRKDQSTCYSNLGTVFGSRSEYDKAAECFEEALVIKKEIGDRLGEATCYGNLAVVFASVGRYDEAEEYLEKALMIRKEIGDKNGEASCYGNLGTVFRSVGEYVKAEQYLQKALLIGNEIGDRNREALCYGNLGTVFRSTGEYEKAEVHFQKALAIRKEIGDRQGEAIDYGNLGNVYRYLGEHTKAREFHTKALALSKEINDVKTECTNYASLSSDMLAEGNVHEAISNLFSSIEKCEVMRTYLRDNDQFKISFFDGETVSPYRKLGALLCALENADEALYVIELGRARALADLMSAQYAVEKQTSVDLRLSFGIEKIMKNENDCTCLYISYFRQYIYLWILKANKPIIFRRIDANDCFVDKREAARRSVDDIFGKGFFRRLHVLPQEHCEDRSLPAPLNGGHSTCTPSQNDSMVVSRPRESEEDEFKKEEDEPSLAHCYKMLIAPVANLLDQSEVIIVPDRLLYNVPFAALKDATEAENRKYLSETSRIRIVPSLTTLKLIQDSPADYHSQTGALIVGEPKVDKVSYKGCIKELCPLPCARKEAEMIGRLLGVQPLLGQQATKQAVLQNIDSVALIHFAAHGNADSGQIALAPVLPPSGIPHEEDYLLTMADIANVQLRAKLVVLSCCHSAKGQIRSEGVVGIARAFLGSGARSVLVAMWALEDKATEQFMSRFYEHLVRGKSASESLHQTMEWMRANGFSDLRQWAPFTLIGDNVTFDFGREEKP